MKTLVLCKRQYTGKDLIDDRFGRLHELPRELSRLGHSVRVCALSYRNRGENAIEQTDELGVQWHSINAFPDGLYRYSRWLDQVTADWRPNVVWASSDMIQALLAMRWTSTKGIPCLIDLYDNYEAFGLSKIPGLARAFRSACQKANGLTVVSEALAGYISSEYHTSAPIHIVVNGVQEGIFHPMRKTEARSALSLPADARIIGSAGSLTADRGIEDMFEAFLQLSRTDENIYLAHAGPTDNVARRYRHERIFDLGVLDQIKVPGFLASLDVGIVCNRDSAFGRYCFPLKLHEMLAMRIPIVAAALGDTPKTLRNDSRYLYPPGDKKSLASRISNLLESPSLPDTQASTWRECALKLDSSLRKASGSRSRQIH
ncbi:glycosyltransferase family 4 protein [Xanthomonas sp. AM6]|uniref:glycosyltransferase family 4 protein n=1 Tax=Xanthomonas sp. AM6 TaxID=2982531 RepID=UPI0021DB0816|nr:glycosyltransferase family 4 protein [Xanthomonas sp. AM6]UYB53342.1 glycosyltransferase family 4 protein [Xanthomonas sp. AM6]